MKYKIAELEGPLLDAAVAKVEGLPVHPGPGRYMVATPIDTRWAHEFRFSRDWKDGGPIIEREHISLVSPDNAAAGGGWRALVLATLLTSRQGGAEPANVVGPTPLIAAMRAYVASKYGDEVELP